jgi:hypothetical protein
MIVTAIIIDQIAIVTLESTQHYTVTACLGAVVTGCACVRTVVTQLYFTVGITTITCVLVSIIAF